MNISSWSNKSRAQALFRESRKGRNDEEAIRKSDGNKLMVKDLDKERRFVGDNRLPVQIGLYSSAAGIFLMFLVCLVSAFFARGSM